MAGDNEQDQTSLGQNQFDYNRRVFADPTMAPQYESFSRQLALLQNTMRPPINTGAGNPLIPGSLAQASPYTPTAGHTTPLHPWMAGSPVGQQPITQQPNASASLYPTNMPGAQPAQPTMPTSPTMPTQPTPVAGAGGMAAPQAPGVRPAQPQAVPPQPQLLSDEEMPDGHYLNTAGQQHPQGAPGSPMNIHVKPTIDQMMNWNKPFNQQSEAVQAALKTMNPNVNPSQTGADMYKQQVINHMLQQNMGYGQAKTAASQTFHNNGIPGTTISDGNNTGMVVFHPSNLEYSSNGYQLQPVDYQPTFGSQLQADAQGQVQG